MSLHHPCPCTQCRRRPIVLPAVREAVTIVLIVLPSLWVLIGSALLFGA